MSDWYRLETADVVARLGTHLEQVVKVRRDDRVQEISARELVPGDIVLLEAQRYSSMEVI